jgi:hypothetical protein
MIRIGFGMTNISVGFGTGLNFKAIMKGIRIAIGTVVMKAAEFGDLSAMQGRTQESGAPHGESAA